MVTGTYTENFDRIGNWGANFTGTGGVIRFSVATAESPGTLPNQNTVFSSGSGVQKGPYNNTIVLYASHPSASNAAAFDLNLDFTNTTAGNLSFDWSSLSTQSGYRQARFSVRTNSGTGDVFEELPGSAVTITNNRPTNGSINITLPSAFNGKSNAKIRFYIQTVTGTANSSLTGFRPRMTIDNIRATATYVGTNPNTITTNQPNQNTFTVTTTNPSSTFTVPYTSTGTFTGEWRVQLSNNEGVFSTDETFNIIGSSTGSSPITAQIPTATPCGTGYQVRVINTAPLRFGSSNGSNLTVNSTIASNAVTLDNTEAQSVTPTTTGSGIRALSASPSTFVWVYRTGTSGTLTPISGATTNTYTINGANFPGAGTYQVVARATSSSACGSVSGDSSPLTVYVQSIFVSPATLAFAATRVGLTSSAQIFTITGSGVSENLIVTPPAGFQIRLSGTTAEFQSTALTVTPVNNSVNTPIDVRFVPTAAQAYSGNISVANSLNTVNVAVSGTGQDVGVSTTALSFGPTPTGSTSAVQNFNVTGVGLTSNVTVSPPSGYQIRLAGSTNDFSSTSLTLTPTGGNVNATIEVRLAPTAVQAYNGNITVASNTSTVNVAVSGSGITTPAVTTKVVSSITASSATTGGDITSNNGANVTGRGVVWSRSPNPTLNSGSSTTDGTGTGGFTSALTNLLQNTLYYVRAYATNAAGTAYGNEIQFTTQPAAPTQQVSNITFPTNLVKTNSLNISWTKGNGTGTVVKINKVNSFSTPINGQAVGAVNSAYTADGEQTVFLGDNTVTSATVTNLQPGTQYWFRVYEINNSNENIRYNTEGDAVSAATTVPLPVEMVYFTGKLFDYGVYLEWETASESNSSHFNIIKSFDAKHFNKIGSVESVVKNSTGKHYSFKDFNTVSGTIYYALEQVDLDGTTTRSSLISVKVQSAPVFKVSISPNPVQNTLNVLNPGRIPVYQSTIFNSSGEKLLETEWHQPTTEQIIIDVSQFAPGLYILQLVGQDLSPQHLKFLKASQ